MTFFDTKGDQDVNINDKILASATTFSKESTPVDARKISLPSSSASSRDPSPSMRLSEELPSLLRNSDTSPKYNTVPSVNNSQTEKTIDQNSNLTKSSQKQSDITRTTDNLATGDNSSVKTDPVSVVASQQSGEGDSAVNPKLYSWQSQTKAGVNLSVDHKSDNLSLQMSSLGLASYTDDNVALWNNLEYQKRPLPPPLPVPKPGEYQDVYVLSVFDPHNFVVSI